MFKTEVKVPHKSPTRMSVTSMPVGSLGVVMGGPVTIYNGIRIAKMASFAFDVNNPNNTWTMPCTLEVELIPDATVTLTFGKGA